MIRCLILGCDSAKNPTDESNGVLFFEFPTVPDIRRKWCDSIEAFQGPLTEFTVVCERHFEPEAIVADQNLKRDAVPTMFEPDTRPSSHKTLLEVINECVERDAAGQVRCKLQEKGVPCGFSLERFESRALVRHICEVHSAYAGLVGFPGIKNSNNMKPTVRGKIVGLKEKVLGHVSLEPDGYHCRIEDSTCLYFDPNLFPSKFARHFRDMHPMKAFDNGYFDGFRREDISLKKRVKFKNRINHIKTLVRSKVVYDGTYYRCNIGRSQCSYSVKMFNTVNIRRHICEQHPAEANQYRLIRTKRPKLPNSENLRSKQESLSSKFVQMVEANVVRTRNGIVRCRISTLECKYKQRNFVPANFYCHFCINHPVEARAKGFFASEESSGEKSCEREPTPVPMETADEFILPEQDLPPSTQEISPEAPEPPYEPNEDDDLRLTTPSDDPSTYCRLCFSIAKPLRPIFTGPEDIGGGGLVELISNCTNIRLSAQTDCPSSVCYECQLKLDDIQRFRQLCETLDTVVRRQGRMKRDVSVESDDEPEVVSVVGAPPQVEAISNSNDDGDSQQSAPEKKHTELKIRDQTYFKCTECGFLAVWAENVRRHYARIHNIRTKSAVKHSCPVNGCSEIFFTSKSYRDHLNIVHCFVDKMPLTDDINICEVYVKLEESKYACRNCGKMYPSVSNVVDHFHQSHRRTKIYRKDITPRESSVDDVCRAVVVNGVSYFKCRDCEVMIKKKSDVAVHWLQQHGGGGNGSQ